VRQSPPVDRREPQVEIALELGGWIHGAGRRTIGHLRGGDQVAAPELDAVDPDLLGGGIDEALEKIGELGARDAAVRRDRRGVGEHPLEREMVDRNAIRPAHHRRHPVHQNEHRARGEVAAVTPGRSYLQREEAAVAI
jgi:hypothetical protein